MINADYGDGYTYPAALLAAATAVEDWSYGNDTAAHIHITLHGGRTVALFVEHHVHAKREYEQTPRFTVFGWDEEGEQPDYEDDYFETEDPYALIGYVFEQGER